LEWERWKKGTGNRPVGIAFFLSPVVDIDAAGSNRNLTSADRGRVAGRLDRKNPVPVAEDDIEFHWSGSGEFFPGKPRRTSAAQIGSVRQNRTDPKF